MSEEGAISVRSRLRLTDSERYTIRDLFEEEVQFLVPSYQRAYSWEVDGSARSHVKQFVRDLRDQHPNKDYYLGHFIFEGDVKLSRKLFAIDGQQRLTTVVIFFSCLVQELKSRILNAQDAVSIAELNPSRLAETYLRRGTKRRFKTVENDASFFDERILDRTSNETGDTRSRRRIAEAQAYFTRTLNGEDTSALVRWARLVERAAITTFKVRDKVQATQIFSFENDRGKGLTDLEKLKAFLVYQIYLNSDENEEIEAIGHIEAHFADIYLKTEEINLLNEDQVLSHHCIAYLKTSETSLEAVKSELDGIGSGMTRVEWVKCFSSALKDSFRHVKDLEKLLSGYESIADLVILGVQDAWPILIKLHREFGDELTNSRFARLFRAMELTLFKLRLLHGRCVNDLPRYAKEFDFKRPEAIAQLQERLENAAKYSFRGGQDCNKELRDALDGNYQYREPFGYLLWKYENSLRADGDHHILPVDFMGVHGRKTHEKTIDHIAPQGPQLPYSEEFARDCLNNLGNLVYMTRSMNSSKRNRPPLDLADAFWDSTCASHREIKKRLATSGKWDREEIEARRRKITEFALERWEAK